MKTTIIGIAGGTASGKTTIAKILYETALQYGSVAHIRLDDYYHDNSHLTFEERRKINYDHPDTYDSKLLLEHLLFTLSLVLSSKESIFYYTGFYI